MSLVGGCIFLDRPFERGKRTIFFVDKYINKDISMPVSEETKKIIAKESHLELTRDKPLMDIDAVKEEVLGWLEQIRYPGKSENETWENCMAITPPLPEERKLESGLRIRIRFRLFTEKNQYLISILESLDPASRGNYILATHVNWQEKERQLQKLVEQAYKGQFDDILKARHTIWIQTFRIGELFDGLNSCAVAILENELVDKSRCQSDAAVFKVQPIITNFPDQDK